LNGGVSVVEIAGREDVGEKRMRALVRDTLARRMPEPPAQFVAMQVSRLNEALHVSLAPCCPDASEAPEQVPRELAVLLADRIRREMAPQGLEKIESAPGNGMAPEAPDPQDMVRQRNGAFASALSTRPAKLRFRSRRRPGGKWRRNGTRARG
jgi:hypothetical protein